jgi:hypothetical protein
MRSGVRQSVRRTDDRQQEEVVEDRQAGLSTDIMSYVLRRSFAGLAADLGYNEPTITSLIGHETHSVTRWQVHSADPVLLAAADAVANAPP